MVSFKKGDEDMKKLISFKQVIILAMMLLVIGLLAACGGQSSDNTNDNGNQSSDNTNSTENKSEDEDDGKTYTLKMTSAFTPPADENARDGKNLGTKYFAEEIEKRTDGRVKVEVYFSNQLVPQDQILDAVKNGTVDMANTSAYWGDILPTQDFIWMPFGFKNPDHYLHVMRETEAGELFEQEMEDYGAKLLMHWSSGYQGIISTKPIDSIDDVEGMTMRLPTGVWEPWYKEMGVAAANVAASEQYEALSRGLIDATVFPYYTIDLYKFNEVAKHTVTPAIVNPMMAMNIINVDKWNEFPEDIQQIIMDVSLELEKEGMEYVQSVFDNSMKFAEENGVEIHELSPDELERFMDSAQVVYDTFASKNENTKKMVDILLETQKDFE